MKYILILLIVLMSCQPIVHDPVKVEPKIMVTDSSKVDDASFKTLLIYFGAWALVIYAASEDQQIK